MRSAINTHIPILALIFFSLLLPAPVLVALLLIFRFGRSRSPRSSAPPIPLQVQNKIPKRENILHLGLEKLYAEKRGENKRHNTHKHKHKHKHKLKEKNTERVSERERERERER